MTRLFTWNNVQKWAFFIVLGVQNQAFSSSDFQYFGSDIDYWHEGISKPNVQSPQNKTQITGQISEKSGEEAKANNQFQWQKYLDPQNKEFFKEGDYTPPEPFIEVVKNPTDSNLKMWFSYIDMKNELTRKFQERVQEYLAKNSGKMEEASQTALKERSASLSIAPPDAKRFRFRMYFDSHCPHCKKMFGTLSELQAKGYDVEAKQVDPSPIGMEGVNIPTTRASPGEVKEKDIQSVPVLLIGDLEKKLVYRLTGYQSTSAVFAAIQQASLNPGSTTN